MLSRHSRRVLARLAAAATPVAHVTRTPAAARPLTTLLRRANPLTGLAARRAYSTQYPSHTVINMPALSPTMESGNIGAWSKKVGDAIAPGDVLCEVETDKATMDFEASEEGYIAQILIPENTQNVPVGTPLYVLVEDEGDVAAFKDFVAPKSDAPAASETPAPTPAPTPAAPAAPAAAPPAAAAPAAPAAREGGRVFASPFAKKLAAERQIDLAAVKGTGPAGRVVAEDVLAYKPAPKAAAKDAPKAAPKPAAKVAPVDLGPNTYTDVPLTNMRRVIAARLSESKSTIPHYYLTMNINMNQVLQVRALLAAQGTKVSVNDFVVKAAAVSLVKHKQVNAHWLGDAIREFDSADISVAVATPTGLITPIVKAAETKGLGQISSEVKSLAKRARDNKLQPQEFQGGTFTISNLGMFGISQFTAIINPPQSAILAVGASEEVLGLNDEGETVVNQIMKVTMSSDHRVIDGAVGSAFLQTFKHHMENPLTLMV